MEKNKNVWNDKGKNIFLKVLHIVCYVLSALFIVVAVYSCAHVNKGKEQKKSLHLNQPQYAYVSGQYTYFQNQDDLKNFLINAFDNNYTAFFNYMEDYDLSDMLNIYCYNPEGEPYILTCLVQSSEDSRTIYLYVNEEVFLSLGDNGQNVLSEGDWAWEDNDYISYPLYSDNYFISYNSQHINVYNTIIGYDNDNLFGTMTDSTEGFIDTLGDGLNSVFSVFYNDGLTTIGILMTIVVGAGLLWVLFRLVVGLIRLRG